MKHVGEPCAGEPHARIDGGRLETERWVRRPTRRRGIVGDRSPNPQSHRASCLPYQQRRWTRMDEAAQSSMWASPVEFRTTLNRRLRTRWTVTLSNFKAVDAGGLDEPRRTRMDGAAYSGQPIKHPCPGQPPRWGDRRGKADGAGILTTRLRTAIGCLAAARSHVVYAQICAGALAAQWSVEPRSLLGFSRPRFRGGCLWILPTRQHSCQQDDGGHG